MNNMEMRWNCIKIIGLFRDPGTGKLRLFNDHLLRKRSVLKMWFRHKSVYNIPSETGEREREWEWI